MKKKLPFVAASMFAHTSEEKLNHIQSRIYLVIESEEEKYARVALRCLYKNQKIITQMIENIGPIDPRKVKHNFADIFKGGTIDLSSVFWEDCGGEDGQANKTED